MRKKIFILVFVFLYCAAMTGCGKSIKEENGEEPQFKEEEEEPSGLLGDYFEDSYEASVFEQSDVDSDTVQWICSAYSIYTHYNRKELGCVGGIDPEDRDVYQFAVKTALADGWSIADRDSAISQIRSLLEKGHRKKYREFIAEMKEHNLLSLTEEELLERVEREHGDVNEFKAAYRAYHALGEKALDAWDYSRALQILGDCYQAEYISLEECLDQSLAVAEVLQAEFSDWDEVCESYLYGYNFWKKDDADDSLSDTADRWEIYEELKEMEDGPFSVPYDTELKESWKNVIVKQEKEETEEEDDGTYLLSDIDDKITVEVTVPEEFDSGNSMDEHTVFVDYYNEKTKTVADLMYDISENMSEEDILRNINLSLAMSVQNGAEDMEIGEIKSMTVGEWEINYVTATFKSNGNEHRDCTSWAKIDNTYMVSCGIGDCDLRGDFLYPDLEEMLEVIYNGIKKTD